MINNAWKLDDRSKFGDKYRDPNASSLGGILGTSGNRTLAKKPEKGVPTNATEQQILKYIQTCVKKRGARGIRGIQRKWKIADDDRSRTLDRYEFKKAMNDFRIGLDDNQIDLAYDMFDRDGNGGIIYDEFLRCIVGEMNQNRKAIAMQAFQKMDKDGSGSLELDDIRQTYNDQQ